MKQQFSSMVTGSKNKHESDIPVFAVHSVITQYYSDRMTLIQQLSVRADSKPTIVLPELTQSIWRRMEKRFILHGKVRLEKESTLHGLSDLQWLEITIMLAHYLLDEFEEKSDWNSLNSAVRLSEYLLKQLNDTTPALHGLAALLDRELQLIQQIDAGNYD
jgi:hypothetical protein